MSESLDDRWTGLLPAERAEPLQRNLDILADGVDELVRYGARMHSLRADAGRRDAVADLPLNMLLRHIMEMLDATSALIRASSVEPATLQLRSALEAGIQALWLARDEDKWGMAYMAWFTYDRLHQYERYDRTSQRGKELMAKLKGTAFDNYSAVADVEQNAAAQQHFREMLALPMYAEGVAEYERTKRERGRVRNWFSLYDGPRSLEELADHVGLRLLYEVFYRQWSNYAHGGDVMRGKFSRTDTGLLVHQLRMPFGVEQLYTHAVSIAFSVYRGLTEPTAAAIPNEWEQCQSWYRTRVMPLHLLVLNSPPFIKREA